MNCPKCMGNLNPVKVEGHYGSTIVIDQCSTCKGLWFDPAEYYQVSRKFVDQLDPVNSNFDQEIANAKELYICPKDGALLYPCENYSIPKDLNIEVCRKCHGYWFDKGEFRNLSQVLETKRNSSTDFADGITSYLRTLSNESKYDTVARISEVLMKPYNSSNYSFDNISDPKETIIQVVGGVISVILRLLLRV